MSATKPAPSAGGLIHLSDPARPLPHALLDAPGGFAWWYVDHLDAQGDGLVLIWSFGLPVLPGYLDAARAGRPEPPRARPSVNLALYTAGRPTFYLLQTYAPEDAAWGEDTWQLGGSRFTLRTDGGARALRAQLDLPLPRGGALTGEVTLQGGLPDLLGTGAPGLHEWCPVMGPAALRAELQLGGERITRQGLAYHDRNGGAAPLDRLGVDRWTWGRLVEADRARIYYVLWPAAGGPPEAWGLTMDAAGTPSPLTPLAVQAEAPARARYGLRHPRRLQLATTHGIPWLTVTTTGVVDDGPFYLRTLVEADGVSGFGEWVVPGAVDRGWQRPFVRMRVHHPGGPNSFWLPLFAGPSQGRLQRLLSREARR
jgi:carotenoid 1,2-hydratase